MWAPGRPAYGGLVRIRLTDLGVAAIPLVLGLWGPGAHDAGFTVALCVALSVPLYWRRRCPLAVLLVTCAIGLAQVLIIVADGPSPRTPPGLYDLGIVIAIYSAVAYGPRLTRLLAVGGGICGAVAGTLMWLTALKAPSLLIGMTVLFAPVLVAW